MSAGQEAYDRLIAARRFVSDADRAEAAKEAKHIEERARIRRRLPKVY